MALILVILVIIGTIAYCYLKCSLMQSLVMFFSSILALIIAFSFYETLAEQLIARDLIVPWAQFICFLVLYILTAVLFLAVSDYLLPSSMELGSAITVSTKVICGLLAGFIFSGALLTSLGLLPMQGKLFYSRFQADGALALNRPSKPALNSDGFVTGLYSLISGGSLSSDKNFGVIHADYLSQNHLNKLKKPKEILAVCSKNSLTMPTGKGKQPVRMWDFPDAGKLTVVRVGISTKNIKSGGAGNATGNLNFLPFQISLVTKAADSAGKPLTGKGTAVYPTGFVKNGSLVQPDMKEIIIPESTDIVNRVYWLDVAFEVPSGQVPVLLKFKQNALVDLTPYKTVETTPEIESALESDGSDEESA